ncbi:hypothetical protein WJX73_006646 [Symbiochloris irregularis]|uniref:Oxysterol-binding protein n=1 Tax=Symbiochloris irregularis TaxID=706552 RepID=A0AAW1PC97_9CHLO
MMDALSGAWDYASRVTNSLLYGEDDLEVVDPNSKEADHEKLEDANAEDKRTTEFKDYRNYIGTDITSLVALPLFIMEPYTMLQKVAEIMEYTELLDKAAETEDPHERLAWVAGFCLGPFGSNERTWKPFNPILGETFELDGKNGVRFLAEQVSHHPPVSAGHAENSHWVYDIVSAPTTRFLGNSVEIFPVGRSRIKLRKTGEEFSLVPPNSKAHNVIMGRTWVDCYGNFTLLNVTTGARVQLYFTPCGWFSSGRYEVSGHVISAEGKKVLALDGAWNSHLDMARCDEEGDPLPDAHTTRLWNCEPKPAGDKYGFTHFAIESNNGKGLKPLPSDSRRRADRKALQDGETGVAATEKVKVEEAQRQEKKERQRRGEEWQPRWFRPASDATVHPGEATPEQCPMFDFTGSYLTSHPLSSAPPSDDCAGKGFFPWQYAELHKQQ